MKTIWVVERRKNKGWEPVLIAKSKKNATRISEDWTSTNTKYRPIQYHRGEANDNN